MHFGAGGLRRGARPARRHHQLTEVIVRQRLALSATRHHEEALMSQSPQRLTKWPTVGAPQQGTQSFRPCLATETLCQGIGQRRRLSMLHT